MVYSFTAGAFGAKLDLLRSAADLPRLLIPVTVVVAVFLLRNRRRHSGEVDYRSSFVDIILAGAATIFSQLALSHFVPEFAMPQWAPTQGGMVGWMFLAVVGTLFQSGQQDLGLSAWELSTDEIRWKSDELASEIRIGHLTGSIVGLISLAACGVGFAQTEDIQTQAGFSAILLFIMFLLGELILQNVWDDPGEWRAFHAAKLQRHGLFLRRVWFGLVGLVVPGCALILVGSTVYPFVVIIYLLLFAEFVLRKAECCQIELSQLELTSEKCGADLKA